VQCWAVTLTFLVYILQFCFGSMIPTLTVLLATIDVHDVHVRKQEWRASRGETILGQLKASLIPMIASIIVAMAGQFSSYDNFNSRNALLERKHVIIYSRTHVADICRSLNICGIRAVQIRYPQNACAMPRIKYLNRSRPWSPLADLYLDVS